MSRIVAKSAVAEWFLAASSSVTVMVTVTTYFPLFSELTITISFAFNFDFAITIAVSFRRLLRRGARSKRSTRSWDLMVARAFLDKMIVNRHQRISVIWFG
jgi:hypothetical protein